MSAVRANSFVVGEQFITFSQFRCHCLLLYQNLRAPAWEGKPLPHLNLCTRKDLHLVPSRYPIPRYLGKVHGPDIELRITKILERELTARAEKDSHFELKNITFKEN